MKIFAHRGASAVAPENTLAAFGRAVEAGADGVELDVHATSDGVPVVIHDRDVSRTTDGSGHVDEMSFDALQGLDAGDGERVPTLRQVLDLLGDSVTIYVEVKQRGIEPAVLDVLRSSPSTDWFVASFDHDTLRRTRALAPDAPLWLIGVTAGEADFALIEEIGATGLSLIGYTMTPAVVARCRHRGITPAVWTINDPEPARAFRKMGVDALCTDDPALIISGLGSASPVDGQRA